MKSAFREKFSYTMAVRGLLGGGSVMVRRMRAFMVANEMGRDIVSVVAVDVRLFSVSISRQPSIAFSIYSISLQHTSNIFNPVV